MRRVVVAAAVGAAVLFGTAAPAAAHTSLKSATPAKGSTVAPPSEVVLTFDDPVMVPQIVVTDTAGNRQEAGRAKAVDNKVTQPLRGSLPSGEAKVGWRVVATDGHPVTGTFRFTVKGGASSGPASQPAPRSTPAAGGEKSSGGGGWLWAGVVAVLAVIGGAAALIRRRTARR